MSVSMAGAVTPSSYTDGDLVLFFQSGTNTLYVDLGNAATVFRGAATGADVTSILNMININTELNAAFGAGWTTATDLYMGLAAFNGTAANGNGLANGDPLRTLYVSQARDAAGSVGAANSAGYTVLGDTAMSTGATRMQSMISPFKNAGTGTLYLNTTASSIDDQNPISMGNQDTAFGIFAGGVQQVGTAGLFASSFGEVSNVEFALDLYRIEARNNIAGQVGQGEALRTGTYEGTITLDSAGNVSFLSVPEPSTYAMVGLGLAAALFMIRRRKFAVLNS